MIYIGSDSETTGSSFSHGAEAFCWCFASNVEFDYSVRLDEGVRYKGGPANLPEEDDGWFYVTLQYNVNPFTRRVIRDELFFENLRILKAIIRNPEYRFVFHNVKFDLKALATIGIFDSVREMKRFLRHRTQDTVHLSHLVNSDRDHALKPLAAIVSQIPADDEKDLKDTVEAVTRLAMTRNYNPYPRLLPYKQRKPDGGWWKVNMWLPQTIARIDKKPLTHPHHNVCARYCRRDAKRTLCVEYDLQGQAIVDIAEPRRVQHDATAALLGMELNGISVHMTSLIKEKKRHLRNLSTIHQEIQSVTEEFFNPSSSTQVKKWAFDIFDLPKTEFSKKPPHNPSTGKAWLKTMVAMIDNNPSEYSDDPAKVARVRKFLYALYLYKKVKAAVSSIKSYQEKVVAWSTTSEFSDCSPYSQQSPSVSPENLTESLVPQLSFSPNSSALHPLWLLSEEHFCPEKEQHWVPSNYREQKPINRATVREKLAALRAVSSYDDLGRLIHESETSETTSEKSQVESNGSNLESSILQSSSTSCSSKPKSITRKTENSQSPYRVFCLICDENYGTIGISRSRTDRRSSKRSESCRVILDHASVNTTHTPLTVSTTLSRDGSITSENDSITLDRASPTAVAPDNLSLSRTSRLSLRPWIKLSLQQNRSARFPLSLLKQFNPRSVSLERLSSLSFRDLVRRSMVRETSLPLDGSITDKDKTQSGSGGVRQSREFLVSTKLRSEKRSVVGAERPSSKRPGVQKILTSTEPETSQYQSSERSVLEWIQDLARLQRNRILAKTSIRESRKRLEKTEPSSKQQLTVSSMVDQRHLKESSSGLESQLDKSLVNPKKNFDSCEMQLLGESQSLQQKKSLLELSEQSKVSQSLITQSSVLKPKRPIELPLLKDPLWKKLLRPEKARRPSSTAYLHPSLNPTGTGTTRLASRDPNGQNIGTGKDDLPDRSPLKKLVKELDLSLRRLFGPAPGRVWLSIDYHQLQLFIFAVLSQEKAMLDCVARGEDMHDATTRQIYGTPKDKTPDKGQRTVGKNVNFGFVFGAGDRKLASAGIPGIRAILNSRFPDAVAFINENKKIADETGYVLTPGGYPLRTPDGRSYAATNYIVQGAEGELVKKAITLCDDFLDSHYPETPYLSDTLIPYDDYNPVLVRPGFLAEQIHDELLFDLPITTDLPYVIQSLMDCMIQGGAHFGFKLKVEAKLITTNWAEGTECHSEQLQYLANKLEQLEYERRLAAPVVQQELPDAPSVTHLAFSRPTLRRLLSSLPSSGQGQV